jgi:hypothetical protein
MHAKTLTFLLALTAAAPTFAAEILRDDFHSTASGWQNKAATTDKDLGFAVYTDSGKYQMTPVHDDTFGFIPAPRQAENGNVRIESDLFVYAGIGAGAGGLACRFQDHQNFYAFLVRGDAALLIVKIKNGKATPLAQGKVKSVMAGTADTRLSVECNGDTLRFKAKNGSTLEARDGDLVAGRSGLVVIGQKMAGTSAAFDNFVLATP